tara:strand:- start:43 stop:381 length:339 start_codon:yes stop_codon:yes gene_type:complete
MSRKSRQLSNEELKGLAQQLVPFMLAQPDPVVEDDLEEGTEMDDDGNIIYTDPIIQTANETTERAMKALPTGTSTYVGRNSTQIVNHSAETMNAIEDWKKKRNQWKTRNTVR